MKRNIRNYSMTIVLLVALMYLASATPVMAQPTPFLISGEVYMADGTPCTNPWVRITNLNSGVGWNAENSSASNYYQLVLDSDDVSVGDTLQFDVSGCSQSKTMEHEVVQSEIDSGGFTGTITLKGDEPPPQQPDLEITEKYETLADGTFTVTYIVTNIGGAAAGASTTCIYIDGVLAATDSVPALAPAESHTGTVGPFDCPCGTTVTVKVCADNDSVVDESDETNNCLENELACPICPKPDLVITQKSEAWVSMEDKTYSITYTIANTGTADADASTTFITIDGNEVATDPVPELSAGESYTKTLGPFTMSGDDDAIKVCADRDDAVSESNEVNNCRENSFGHQIAAVPVLTPLGLTVLISLLSVFSVMNIRRRGK
jgi:subtilase family serine protease